MVIDAGASRIRRAGIRDLCSMRTRKISAVALQTAVALALITPTVSNACSEHKDGHREVVAPAPVVQAPERPPSLGKSTSAATVVPPPARAGTSKQN